MGVPSKSAFLFDANTLYMNSLALLGYKVPLGPDSKLKEEEIFLGSGDPE